MSTSGRAAVLSAAGGAFELATVEFDDPREDEVLVRIVATGMCHTDLGVKVGGIPFPLPGVIGHEGAGVVEAVGSAVSHVAPGDRVVLSFSSCGHCPACDEGHPAYCVEWMPRNLFRGTRADGSAVLHSEGTALGGKFFGQSSFADYAVADARSVVKVPDDAPLDVLAPLGCGVQTGVGSVWNALDVQPEHSFAVFGAGAVGLSALMAAVVRGAQTIVAVDIVPERLALATELGATHVVDGRGDDVVARVQEATGGGVDRALDTTGNPRVGRTALDSLAVRGHLVVCGAPPPGTQIPVDIQGVLVGKTLSGITMGDADPATLVAELVRLHADGRLPLEKLVRVYEPEDLEQAAHDMHEGRTVKPVIRFGSP